MESADIIAWIDKTFEGPSLVPQDQQKKAEMEELMRGPCNRVVSAGLGFVAGAVLHIGETSFAACSHCRCTQ